MKERHIIVRGIAHHRSKLNDEKVLEIRAKYPQMNAKELAAIYNVSQTAIYQVLHRRSWRHV